jgi:hypothetical protein
MAKKKETTNPLGLLLPILQPPPELREMAAKAVLEEIGALFARISCPDSGRILESSLQLLPEEVFKTMAYLTIGHADDEITRGMIYELACRLAQKLGMEFESTEPIVDAANNILMLVNAEDLRRKGHAEYIAPDNIFTSKPKYPGYNKLTDAGKLVAYTEILEMNTTPPKYVM